MSEFSVHAPLLSQTELRLARTAAALRKNRFDAQWFRTKEEALACIRETIPENAVVANGGSMTLAECGVMDLLRSGKYRFLDREGVPREEVAEIYHKALSADYFLMSSNAITENGELYNVDGNGNRVAALIYGPQQVIVLAGANKIVPNIEAAVDRVKHITAPANAIRLHCDTPCAKTGVCAGARGDMPSGCKSEACICCQYVVSGFQRVPGRIKVILVAESLGY